MSNLREGYITLFLNEILVFVKSVQIVILVPCVFKEFTKFKTKFFKRRSDNLLRAHFKYCYAHANVSLLRICMLMTSDK